MRPRSRGGPPGGGDRPRRWRPDSDGGAPEGAGGGRAPRVNWRAAAPGLVFGGACGAAANALLGGAALSRQAIAGFLGVLLAAVAFRALGVSRGRRLLQELRVIAGLLGAGAVIIVGRMLG